MKKSLILAFFLIIFIVYYSFGQFPKYLYGIISYYSDEYIGKKTANGETYDPLKLTAAHRTLPLGTEVEIENLENNKKVRVTINDRGPLVDNRILDVSKKAAEDLGFIKKGTVYAKVTLIKIGDNKVKDETTEPTNSASSSSSSVSTTSQLQTFVSSSSTAVQQQAVSPSISIPNAVVNPVVPVVQNSPSVPATLDNKKSTPVTSLTNLTTVYVTNSLVLTNFIPVQVTNIVMIQPYEEKVVQRDLNSNTPGAFAQKGNGSFNDEFILDEPVDNIPITALSLNDTTVVPEQPSVNKPLSGNNTKKPVVNEMEVTPETLLSNEVIIPLDEKEIKKSQNAVSNKSSAGNYTVQAGAFTQEEYALKLYDQLKKNGFDVFTMESVVKGKKWIKVRTGYYSSPEKAKEVLDKLKKLKISGEIIKL